MWRFLVLARTGNVGPLLGKLLGVFGLFLLGRILRILFDFAAEHGPAILLRIGVGAGVGLLLGAVLVPTVYILTTRRGWLEVDRPWGKWLRRGILVLWIIGLPLSFAWSGGIFGAGIAARKIVIDTRIGERAGTAGLGVLSAFAAAQLDGDESRPWKEKVKRYLDGEAEVAIADLNGMIEKAPDALSEHMDKLDDYFPEEVPSAVRDAGQWVASGAWEWLLKSKVKERTAFILPVVEELKTRDEADDGDGRANVLEIAGAMAHLHLDPWLGGWVLGLFRSQALLFLLVPLGLILIPLGGIQLTVWYLNRPPKKPETQ